MRGAMSILATLGTRVRGADPRHAAILRGMAIVAGFALLGKLLGAVKETAVAYRYGLAVEVDAYQFIYNLVSWPIGVWASVLTAVLVPLAAHLRAAAMTAPSARPQLQRFRAELFGLALVAGCLLALLAWGAIRVMLATAGAVPDAMARSVAIALPGLLPMLPLGFLIALESAWMLSEERHLNTLFDCIPTMFIAAAVLASPSGGVAALVWGTVAGCAAHLLALVLPGRRHEKLVRPCIGWKSPEWPWFWQGFGIMLAGQALMSLTLVIDQFQALALGTGSVATLSYANRVLSLILTLAAIAVSRATLPVFSGTGTDMDGRMLRVARYWAGAMFVVGLAVMFAAHALAPYAVEVLFERGRFGPADTLRVGTAFRFGLVQLPFYFSSMVLVSYALSQRRYRLIFWSGVIGCTAKVVGNFVLAPPLGVNGIALATGLVYACNALFFHLALGKPR